MALQVRRGTNAERLAITPLAGELIFTTDTKQLYVGDGTTTGGITSIANTIDSVLADTSPQLGGNLDLNSFNITGTGNIDITGTITASGNIIANGNITLGNGIGGDVITIGGTVAGNLVPNANNSSLLGAPDAYWREAWIDQLNIGNQITADRINASIIADDSTVMVDATTGSLTGRLVGDVVGSVFADDSTIIVDAVNGIISPAAIVGDIAVASLTTDLMKISSPTLVLGPSDIAETVTFEMQGFNQGPTGFVSNYPQMHYVNESSYGLFRENPNWLHGAIKFGKVDAENPIKSIAATISSRESHLEIKVDLPDDLDTYPITHQLRLMRDTGYFGVGVATPLASIHTPKDALIGNVLIDDNYITSTTSNSNLELRANGTGTVQLVVPTQSTVGVAGAASALPASPDIYFKINVNGTDYVVPGFAVS